MKITPFFYKFFAVLMLYVQHSSAWAANIQMPDLTIEAANSIIGLPGGYDENKSNFIAYLQSKDAAKILTPDSIEIWREAEKKNLTDPAKAKKCIRATPNADIAMARSKVVKSALSILEYNGIGLAAATDNILNLIRLALTNEMAAQGKLTDGARAMEITITFVDACLNPRVSPAFNTGFVREGFVPYVEPKPESTRGSEATFPNKVMIDKAKRLSPRPIKYESVMTK